MIATFFLLSAFALCLFILYKENSLKTVPQWLCAAALLALAFSLRFLALDHETLDYQNFLTRWVDFFRQYGGFSALKHRVGNYNLPYLYFLAAFSYTDYSDLYLIKFLSIAFDVLLAWGGLRLVSLFTDKTAVRLAAFCGILLLPTVVLNGAYWGQCDGVYVALAIWALWAALSDRPKLSLVFMALSFSFKLQAIFFMPVFFVLFFTGRIRWRDMWIFPATYVAAVLPAVLAGYPFMDTITLYFDQAGSIGSGLNYNSPSLYAFYKGGGDEMKLGRLGIAAAFSFCCVLLWWLCTQKKRLNNRVLFAAFTLTVICIPLFLPHMHDRYFYGADILSFLLALIALPLLPLPFLCSYASLLGYHAYLKMRYLHPMRYGSWALILGAAMVCAYMVASCSRMPKKNLQKKKNNG